MTSSDHGLCFAHCSRKLCLQLLYTFLVCTLWRPGGLVLNTHVNFDEIVCNNKAAISPRDGCSQKWSISHQQTAFGCCSHSCKNTCGSTYLEGLEVTWGQVQDVPGAFAQRVCESAQGEGPLEGTEEHRAELPGSSGMVGAVDVVAEGSLVLIPTQIRDCTWLRQSLKAVQDTSSSARSWR